MIACTFNKKLRGAQDEMQLSIDLRFEKRAFIGVYGASGAGKTSFLRILSGLMQADYGKITFDNSIWYDSSNKIDLPPQRRSIGIVFQDYSLFPNMTVRGNLAYALKRGDSPEIIEELLEIMQLQQLAEIYPERLSGGQKQRVALARAVVQKPKLLLLDEPFSALDEDLRSQLQNYILKVHNRYDMTTILVSHNKSEITRMADRVIVLENGKVINDEKPSELFGVRKVKIEGLVLRIDSELSQMEVEIGSIKNILSLKRYQINEYRAGDIITLEIDYTEGRIEIADTPINIESI